MQIAALDGDGFTEADGDARRANILLENLGRCNLTPRRVGDMAVTAQRILRDREVIAVKLRTILESVHTVTGGRSGVDCSAAFAAYIQIRAG